MRLLATSALLAAVLGGCAAEPPQEAQRAARFGVFRDLILYRRPLADGGSFFLDRFEATRRDWFEFHAATGVAGPTPWRAAVVPEGTESLPVAATPTPGAICSSASGSTAGSSA